MDYKYLLYEVDGGILTITLNRPGKLNALNAVTGGELKDALDEADRDDSVRAVIVTGAGKAFCAGADLSGGSEEQSFLKRFTGASQNVGGRDRGGLLVLRIYDMKKPLIAAINGAAVGAGLSMTLPMDVRIAARGAKMGFPFTRRGIVMESCSSWFLPRLVGMGAAAEWVYSGRVFEAEEALQKGLVSEVLDSSDLLPRARDIAGGIIAGSAPVSVALCRQMMWKMLGADHPIEANIIESRLLNWAYRQPDAREGVMSFVEKRKPGFTMKVSKDMPEFYPWWAEREFRP